VFKTYKLDLKSGRSNGFVPASDFLVCYFSLLIFFVFLNNIFSLFNTSAAARNSFTLLRGFGSSMKVGVVGVW